MRRRLATVPQYIDESSHNTSNESAAETSRYRSVSVAWFDYEVAEITLIDEFMRLCALHNSFGPSRYNR